jgi:hypothetical protein
MVRELRRIRKLSDKRGHNRLISVIIGNEFALARTSLEERPDSITSVCAVNRPQSSGKPEDEML